MAQPLIIELYGVWSNNTLTNYLTTHVTSRRRQNLKGAFLKASMVVMDNDTLNHLEDFVDKHIDPITKANYILTNHLVDFLNATVSYSVSNSWGYQDPKTGQWTGLMEDLIEKGYELGATPLFFTLERVDLIEYISMPSPTRSKFVFKSPKLSYTDNVFLLPFDHFVWFSSAGLVLISSVLLLGATYIESIVLNEGVKVG